MRLPDDVAARVRAEIFKCLLCHEVNVTHVVLETGDAPPEPQRVREPRGPLTIECRSYGTMRFDRLEFVQCEVARRIELCYLAV